MLSKPLTSQSSQLKYDPRRLARRLPLLREKVGFKWDSTQFLHSSI